MCKKPQWLQLVLRGLFRGPETLHEGVGNVSTTFKFPEGSKKNLKRPDSRILSKSWLKMPFENPFSKPHRTSKGTLIELSNGTFRRLFASAARCRGFTCSVMPFDMTWSWTQMALGLYRYTYIYAYLCIYYLFIHIYILWTLDLEAP